MSPPAWCVQYRCWWWRSSSSPTVGRFCLRSPWPVWSPGLRGRWRTRCDLRLYRLYFPPFHVSWDVHLLISPPPGCPPAEWSELSCRVRRWSGCGQNTSILAWPGSLWRIIFRHLWAWRTISVMAAWCLCSRYLRMFPLWKSSRATDLSLPPAATTRELKSSLVSLPARWTRTLQSTVARPLLTRHTEPSDNPQSTLARSDLTVVRHKSNLKIWDYRPTTSLSHQQIFYFISVWTGTNSLQCETMSLVTLGVVKKLVK